MIKIVAGTNEGYLEKAMPYLQSLKQRSQLPFTLVTVGFNAVLPDIDTAYISREQNAGAPDETESIQHGSFLHCRDMWQQESDVLVYTDADMILQRPFTSTELHAIAALGSTQHASVYTSWNAGRKDTLYTEAERLSPKVSIDREDELGSGKLWQHMSIFNVGFLAATVGTWMEIYTRYMYHWPLVSARFEHRARQQWLISWIIESSGYDVWIAPYTLHMHGHYGMPDGGSVDSGILTYRGRVVALRHAI